MVPNNKKKEKRKYHSIRVCLRFARPQPVSAALALATAGTAPTPAPGPAGAARAPATGAAPPPLRVRPAPERRRVLIGRVPVWEEPAAARSRAALGSDGAARSRAAARDLPTTHTVGESSPTQRRSCPVLGVAKPSANAVIPRVDAAITSRRHRTTRANAAGRAGGQHPSAPHYLNPKPRQPFCRTAVCSCQARAVQLFHCSWSHLIWSLMKWWGAILNFCYLATAIYSWSI